MDGVGVTVVVRFVDPAATPVARLPGLVTVAIVGAELFAVVTELPWLSIALHDSRRAVVVATGGQELVGSRNSD